MQLLVRFTAFPLNPTCTYLQKKSAKASRSTCVLLSVCGLFSHVTLPQRQLTTMFFISQRDLGRDQTSPCRAWRGVPGQPWEGQHQPNSAGRASSAQVNKDFSVDLAGQELVSLGSCCTYTYHSDCLLCVSTTTLWVVPAVIMPNNRVCQPLPCISCIVCHSVRFGGKSAVLFCSTEGECFMADGGDRWWI